MTYRNRNEQTANAITAASRRAAQQIRQDAWNKAAAGYAISTAKPVHSWYIRD